MVDSQRFNFLVHIFEMFNIFITEMNLGAKNNTCLDNKTRIATKTIEHVIISGTRNLATSFKLPAACQQLSQSLTS